jgi:hypothetical protein
MTSGKHLSECRYTLMHGMVFTQTTFRKLTKWSGQYMKVYQHSSEEGEDAKNANQVIL